MFAKGSLTVTERTTNAAKSLRNQKLQGTACDKRCQRRIYKRSDRSKKCMKSIVCLYIFFWLIRSLVDPTLAAFIVCGPLQFLVFHLFSDRRSFQILYAAFFKHGTGHAVECLNV